MNNIEELYYPFNKGKFDIWDVCGKFQKLIDEYNRVIKDNDINETKIMSKILDIIIYVIIRKDLNEISQAMVTLLLALEKRNNSRTVWSYCASIAFNCGDLEICRELVIFAIKKSSIGDVRNSNREFIKLSKEDKEQNVADILGMVVEELERNN